MIQTEAQLQQALEQIENLCRAVQGLRADVFPKNPRNFAILAEGPVAKSANSKPTWTAISRAWKACRRMRLFDSRSAPVIAEDPLSLLNFRPFVFIRGSVLRPSTLSP